MDLICCYYTVAGVSPAAGGASPLPFLDRVQACAEAGYNGIGLHVRDYRALRNSGMSDADLLAILRDHGVRFTEVEFLLNWFADGEVGEAARRDEDLLYHMVETFGAREMVLGGDMTPGNPMPFDELIERFSRLCERADKRGVTVAVEACAWTNIGDFEDALRLVNGAGAKNAGIYLDVWHQFRRGTDYAKLRTLDPKQIIGVQLCDASATVQNTMAEDSLDYRLLPGEGDANVVEYVALLNELGFSGPYSVEVISKAQRSRTVREAARASYLAAKDVIELASQKGADG